MDLQEAFDAGFEAVKAYIDDTFAQFEKRIAAVEARGVKYVGVWQRAATYGRGDVVTDQGSAWIALRDIEGARPGDAPEAWQLMVKAGRDAR